MSNIQLANNLRYLRKSNQLTQDDMHLLLNISRQAYSNYETGKRTPDLDTLLRLANFYKTNLNDLVLANLADTDTASSGMRESVTPYIAAKDKITGNSIYLLEEEVDFITSFRALSKENKQIIAGFLSDSKKS